MESPVVHFSTILMAFFAIMNPIANAPLFMGLTEGLDDRLRRTIALRAVVLAFLIVTAFSIAGREIFALFGITLPAFRIAGGVLVAMVGYQMLHGSSSAMHAPAEGDAEASKNSALSIAITPLALPVLAGPGTIATAMSFAADSTVGEITRVVTAFAAVCAVTYGAFVAGPRIVRFLGQHAIKVITRLMGLILTVIGVQMLIEGIRGAVAAG